MNKNPLERTIERKLTKECVERGGRAIKIIPAGIAGFPDRLVLLPGGNMFFVELKRQGQVPRPMQGYWHKWLRSLGFRVVVVDSVEMVKEVLGIYDILTAQVSADVAEENN